ncbi:MAG TPA: ELWxxDGT repeat protein [Ilumatobacter sp.]|nr:ELWxxDGT repeat protein [Ilumatobacter sp.]
MFTTSGTARRALAAVVTFATLAGTTIGVAPAPAALAWSGPQRAGDANTAGRSSDPRLVTPAGSKLFAITGSDDEALWVIGAGGTATRLADIGGISPLVMHVPGSDGVVVFTKYTQGSGVELWRSDGTTAGTQLVADIRPGTASSFPAEFTAYRGEVYFTANDGTTGTELWRTDGTTAGTSRVADLNPGSTSSTPTQLAVVQHGADDERLWMVARSGGTDNRLVVYNGNTHETADVFIGVRPTEFVAVKDMVFATATISSSGSAEAIHRIQATGTNTYTASHVVDQTVNQMFALDDELLLNVPHPTHGPELFKLVGSTVTLVQNIYPGSTGSNPGNFVAAGGWAYFVASTADRGRQLWRTDGTTAGTVQAATLPQWAEFPYNSSDRVVTALPNNAIAFVAYAPGIGSELWIKPATASVDDAYLVDIAPGSSSSDPSPIVAWGARLVFTGNDPTHGRELLELSLGDTPADVKTALLADLAPGTDHSDPREPVRAGDRVVFTARSPQHGRELYSTDPATGATTRIDLHPGTGSRYPRDLVTFGDRAMFIAEDADSREALWTTDGTASGTAMIDMGGGFDAWDLTSVGNLGFFTGDDGSGEALWRTDGTAAGTFPILPIPAGTWGWFYDFAEFGNGVVFVAEIDNRAQIYVSDGTAAGTAAFTGDLGDEGVGGLVVVGDSVFAAITDEDDWLPKLWVFTAGSARRVTPTGGHARMGLRTHPVR